jgi:signal transduction histidine kinase
VVQAQAFRSAKWVWVSGLASLALLAAAFGAILQRQVSRPLITLTQATRAMSAGETASLPSLGQREDELGALADSFGEMVGKVAAREKDLRDLNQDLERRVTERTEDLHRALDRERELGEMKGQFVSLVTHEFRTPLGVIMSAVEVLQRYFERLTPEKRVHHLATIFRSTKNLAALIDEVLLLGRVEDGRMEFTPAPLELEKLCRTIADELRSATAEACPIQFTSINSLDGAASDERVLRHILPNLLSNAVKYSEPGSPVDFSVRREASEAVFEIRDRGIGIPEEDQDRLFTSFTRARNVGERPGTGLGLVVVKRCVELHGGRLALQSRPGEGTVVTVALPVFGHEHEPAART